MTDATWTYACCDAPVGSVNACQTSHLASEAELKARQLRQRQLRWPKFYTGEANGL